MCTLPRYAHHDRGVLSSRAANCLLRSLPRDISSPRVLASEAVNEGAVETCIVALRFRYALEGTRFLRQSAKNGYHIQKSSNTQMVRTISPNSPINARNSMLSPLWRVEPFLFDCVERPRVDIFPMLDRDEIAANSPFVTARGIAVA